MAGRKAKEQGLIMQRLFKNISAVSGYGHDSFLNFPIQLAEDSARVMVRTLTPGMRRKDINIVLSGQTLCISGKISCRSGRYLRQECPCGSFSRNVDLGCLVDGDAVQAELKAGVLTIILPKHKKALPKRIEIKYEAS